MYLKSIKNIYYFKKTNLSNTQSPLSWINDLGGYINMFGTYIYTYIWSDEIRRAYCFVVSCFVERKCRFRGANHKLHSFVVQLIKDLFFQSKLNSAIKFRNIFFFLLFLEENVHFHTLMMSM